MLDMSINISLKIISILVKHHAKWVLEEGVGLVYSGIYMTKFPLHWVLHMPELLTRTAWLKCIGKKWKSCIFLVISRHLECNYHASIS